MKIRSPDELDQAAELEAEFLEKALAHQRANRKESKIKPEGCCHTCGEDFEEDVNVKLFCDRLCAMNYKGD